MKSPARTGRFSNGGFTLVEILTVLIIIITVVGMIIGAAGFAQRKASLARTQTEIATMEQALEAFKADKGFYPATGIGNVYNALTAVGARKPYMDFRPDQHVGTTIVDPFGSAYVYTYPGANNTSSFDLSSLGPDRQSGTADDITNWKQ
jgi:general secretion pathway protein G